jgi:ribosomal protein S20
VQDYQLLFNILLGITSGFGGWVLNNMTKAIDRIDTDVRNLPHNYVQRDDFRDAMRELKDDMRSGLASIDKQLGVIFKKLDSKEDKP